jgi:hypothetical protein
MSIYTLAFAGLFPFGSLFAGWLASHFGVADAFRFNALVLLCFAVPTYLFLRKVPRLRTMPREALEALLAGEQQVFQAEQISKG